MFIGTSDTQRISQFTSNLIQTRTGRPLFLVAIHEEVYGGFSGSMKMISHRVAFSFKKGPTSGAGPPI